MSQIPSVAAGIEAKARSCCNKGKLAWGDCCLSNRQGFAQVGMCQGTVTFNPGWFWFSQTTNGTHWLNFSTTSVACWDSGDEGGAASAAGAS